MKHLNHDMSLQEIVIEAPRAGSILRDYGIDYVSNRHTTLNEMAKEKNIDLEVLKNEIKDLPPSNEDDVDIKYLDEISVIKYIQKKYHEDFKDEIQVLCQYVEEAVNKDSKQFDALHQVFEEFKEIKTVLLKQTRVEDDIVFPLFERYFEKPTDALKESLRPYLSKTEIEHELLSKSLKELREVTNNFTPEHEMSGITRLVYERLERLEKYIFDHSHLERYYIIDKILK